MNTKRKAPTQSLMLRRREASELIGVATATLSRMVLKGQFPPPRKLGDNSVAWLRSEVEAWVAARPVSDILSPKTRGAEHA